MIVIISFKLFFKKILLLLILIFLLDNLLLLVSLNNLNSCLDSEKLALLIITFFISIFSLSKKFPCFKNTLKFLISATGLNFAVLFVDILES